MSSRARRATRSPIASATASCRSRRDSRLLHPLPALTNADVADLLQIARTRILRLLGRRGVIQADEVTADGELADREPALAQLVGPGVAGSPPAGPTLRRRDPIQLRDRGEIELRGLCAAEHGFSLHAATTAGAGDRAGKESLCKYILRPPLAQDRVKLVAAGLVRLTLKRLFSDGTVAIDLDPLSLLVRLAMSVPPPRFNSVRYVGVLAAHSSWRARVVPPPPAGATPARAGRRSTRSSLAGDPRPSSVRASAAA
ncbi:MAG: transposase [Polyangiaceae bacterium]|nr:transposase [Polyangiaceae bacterium]